MLLALAVRLPVCRSVSLSVRWLVSSFVCSLVCLPFSGSSVCLSSCLAVGLSAWLSACLPDCSVGGLSGCLPSSLDWRLPVDRSVSSSACSVVCLSVSRLSACLSVCLPAVWIAGDLFMCSPVCLLVGLLLVVLFVVLSGPVSTGWLASLLGGLSAWLVGRLAAFLVVACSFVCLTGRWFAWSPVGLVAWSIGAWVPVCLLVGLFARRLGCLPFGPAADPSAFLSDRLVGWRVVWLPARLSVFLSAHSPVCLPFVRLSGCLADGLDGLSRSLAGVMSVVVLGGRSSRWGEGAFALGACGWRSSRRGDSLGGLGWWGFRRAV